MKRNEFVDNTFCSKQSKTHPNKFIDATNDSLERRVSFGDHPFHRSSSSSTYPSQQSDQLLSCASLVAPPPVTVISHLPQGNKMNRSAGNTKEKKESRITIERIKKLLRVESDDDTENIHDKYEEDTKEREEKNKLIQEMLNSKVDIL